MEPVFSERTSEKCTVKGCSYSLVRESSLVEMQHSRFETMRCPEHGIVKREEKSLLK